MGESAPITSALVSGTQGREVGYQWCIAVVDTELLTFALTFLAPFLDPPPRSLALVPLASGDPCWKETCHFQALEREGANRNGAQHCAT